MMSAIQWNLFFQVSWRSKIWSRGFKSAIMKLMVRHLGSVKFSIQIIKSDNNKAFCCIPGIVLRNKGLRYSKWSEVLISGQAPRNGADSFWLERNQTRMYKKVDKLFFRPLNLHSNVYQTLAILHSKVSWSSTFSRGLLLLFPPKSTSARF